LIPALNMYERCREILEPLSVYVSQEYVPQDPLNSLQHGNGNSNNNGNNNGNGGGGGGGYDGSGGGGGGGTDGDGGGGGGVGGSDPDVIRCMYCMAQICRQLRRYPTALSIYRNLFEIQQKEARREAREAEEREKRERDAAMALAVVENEGGEEGSEEGEAKAAAAARAALKSSSRGMGGGAAVDIASTYFNMALVYKLQNETKKAIEYYMKAREVWAAHRPGGKGDPDAVRLNNRFTGSFKDEAGAGSFEI